MSATLDRPRPEKLARPDGGSVGIAPAQLDAGGLRPRQWLLPLAGAAGNGPYAATPADASGAAMAEMAGYLRTRLRPEPPRLRRR